MTLPFHIAVAAQEGDLDTIRAYFEDDSDGARDVDGFCEDNISSALTPLMHCAQGDDDELNLGNVAVARYLLSRGALINKKEIAD